MSTTWLSEHFSLAELTVTTHRAIDNTPPAAIVDNLRQLATHLELVRSILGVPLTVSSGYRCPTLNREIGGAITSAHLAGWAADFIAPRFGTPLDVCRRLAKAQLDRRLQFDQLIEEGTWVHISFEPRPMRGVILTKDPNGGYLQGLRAAA